MENFLIFTLNASISSMGEMAGHERRGSLMWPGRSLIVGLMGAALGIRRNDDFSRLDSLRIDVAIFDVGTAMRDFHTIQTIPTPAARKPNSRPEALKQGQGKLNSIISIRDYRTDALYGIAVRGENLPEIAQSLHTPHFTLYLGRKSCPLAAPLGAKIVQADTVEEALSQLTLPVWRNNDRAEVLIEEGGKGEIITDVPFDRKRWHFKTREVGIRAVNIAPGGQV